MFLAPAEDERGLKYVSKNRKERISAIAEQLATSNYDIVGLQELWVSADYQWIRNKIMTQLPFSKFFYRHVTSLGAGLAIFSKYPIVAASIHPYSLNGSPLDVTGGDWYVGKSAASVVINHPVLGDVEIFNTHLYAKGGEGGPEERRAHRLVNAWELAKLVRRSAKLGRYLGDFNNVPSALPIKLIREYTGLSDAWEDSHPLSHNRDVLSPQQAITEYGITADSPLNSYSAGKPLDHVARKYQGKRLDYIFYRLPVTPDQVRYSLKATGCHVTFTSRVPGYNFSYSDHFGVEAHIELVPPESLSGTAVTQSLFKLTGNNFPNSSFSITLQALTNYYRISRSNSHFQLLIFAICLTIVLGLIISSAFLPRSWLNPIYILFTVIVSWLATTMLYSGFIYGQWEVNALTNIIEELELAGQRRECDRSQTVTPNM
ncbi:hypothetical protein Clacol_007459 [Clathrus columnatus]|uniref:Endonuclease/exonuclease/phosphatase domain-containing protein n=1 Tax=Clathrus columnatus TaxID=1419009 RepID=A0AAV5AJC1_9AGAM|nr:hypothetical protein Clacol_007459 [Clathrus columnatus]